MKCPFSLPCGWILRAVWQEFGVTLGKMIQSEPTEDAPIGYPYHKAASVQDGVLLDPFEKMFASEIGAAKLGVRKGDLLVCEGGDIGRSAIVSAEPDQLTIIQNSVHRVRSKGRYPVEYLKLVLDAYRHNGWLDVFIGKNTIAHFTAETFNNLLIPLPNPQYANKAVEIYQFEAKAIGDLLSYMESKLNKLSEYRQSLITQAVTKGLDPNVEMKDSGVEWIGHIPQSWSVPQVKYLFSVVCGATPSPSESNWGGDIAWIGPSDMEDAGMIDHGARFLTSIGYKSCGTELVPVGSLILSTRAPIGKVAYACRELCTNQGCKSLVPRQNIETKYFYYVLQAMRSLLEKEGSGTTFMELSTSSLGSQKLPLPSNKEQIAIADYLDKKLKQLQITLDTTKKSIDRLTEYRTSLISAAVTGKIDINEVK